MKATIILKYKTISSRLHCSTQYSAEYPYFGTIGFPPINDVLTIRKYHGRTMSGAVRDFEETVDKWLKDNNITTDES